MTIWRGTTYNPIIDEWENPLSHIFHVHYYQSGMAKDKSFLFVDLHFPDYWWISPYFQVMATCISHSVHYLYALTISLLWYSFPYCDTHFFFLLAYACLAYILNSYLSPSKYIEVFFQSVLVFYSCFWCLITSLSWSFIAFEFCVMLREPQRWKKKHFPQYSFSIYTVFSSLVI